MWYSSLHLEMDVLVGGLHVVCLVFCVCIARGERVLAIVR